jgi:hypothetical protein
MDLTAQHALQLIAQLQSAVTEVRSREEALQKEFRTQRFNIERHFNQSNEASDSWLQKQDMEVNFMYDELIHQIEFVYSQREKLISAAQLSRQRNLPRLAEETRGRWLGRIQGLRKVAERKLAHALNEATAAIADTTNMLSSNREEIVQLNAAAKLAFNGYGMLLQLLKRSKQNISPEPATAEELQHWQQQLKQHLQSAREKLATFEKKLLPAFFAKLPLLVLVPLILALGLGLGYASILSSDIKVNATIIAGGLLMVFLIWFIGYLSSQGAAKQIANHLTEAVRLHERCSAAVTGQYKRLEAQAKAAHDEEQAKLKVEWDKAEEIGREFEKRVRERSKIQAPRAHETNERLRRARLDHIAKIRGERTAKLSSEADQRRGSYSLGYEGELQQLQQQEQQQWHSLQERWQSLIHPIYTELKQLNQGPTAQPLSWDANAVKQWQVPQHFMPATRFGSLALDLAQLGLPQDERLALPGPAQITAPLSLSYPASGSLMFETHSAITPPIAASLNHVILSLLATTPPGKLSFTIIDPVGLGQNFSGLMHLGDYEETVINRRIWTQRDHIEERLAELNEHIEKVIQMYLRNEYTTITEYNQEAGSVAEKYHFLVIADFPHSFSETAAKRLQSITTTGARCGVYTLMHRDLRQALPDGVEVEDLHKSSCVIQQTAQQLHLGKAQGTATLQLDPSIPDALAVELVHQIGKASIDSNRVQVPFSQVAPPTQERWTHDTTQELKVAIGRTGATKLQYLAIGKGTKQHALFAGKTGSGKSTLFHVIITNLALWTSPDEVEFYLIDFKKGVEFKCYATHKLPHARVIAIESDREFGLSVLRRVDEELKRRGEIFRKMGVQDIPGYKRNGGAEPMPRVLLLIDEFQEFFTQDDSVSQSAALLFDRIVRQGRAFGIHVILGSQTLGGSYTMPRTTLGQMVIRVALQCNEADAYLIMDENNPAPRLLTRPGEGIYNDAAGALEGNSPFQVVWLGDEERDQHLREIHTLAQKHSKSRSPIIFEGNMPAELADNDELTHTLQHPPSSAPDSVKVWLGAANSIKGPTAATFQKQSGHHLLIIGQKEDAIFTQLCLAMIALAAQHPLDKLKLVLLHSCAEGSNESQQFDRIAAMIPHGVKICRGGDLPQLFNELHEDLKARQSEDSDTQAARLFLLIHGMQKFKKLRQEDDFSFSMDDSGTKPSAIFTDLITEGAALGMHLIASADSFNNIGRTISRKTLSEIEMRVLYQMSANDSASLIDSTQAADLGMYRAIYHNEQEGNSETFRPYGTAEPEWLETAALALAKLH